LTPEAFSLKTKKYLHRHPVIGVYRFYKNWSTESFRNKEPKSGLFVPLINVVPSLILDGEHYELEEIVT
jgi:hypothetical protein